MPAAFLSQHRGRALGLGDTVWATSQPRHVKAFHSNRPQFPSRGRVAT